MAYSSMSPSQSSSTSLHVSLAPGWTLAALSSQSPATSTELLLGGSQATTSVDASP